MNETEMKWMKTFTNLNNYPLVAVLILERFRETVEVSLQKCK